MSQDLWVELAALEALDVLDEGGSIALQEALAQNPTIAEELTTFQTMVGALAYSAPVVPMATELKQRLFDRIAIDTIRPIEAQLIEAQLIEAQLIEAQLSDAQITEWQQQAQTAQWEVYPLRSGVMIATLDRNPTTREITCLVRAEGPTRFPHHRHAGNEEIVVLAGDLVIGEQQYKPCDRICSGPNTAHLPETRSGCLIRLRTSIDDQILGESF